METKFYFVTIVMVDHLERKQCYDDIILCDEHPIEWLIRYRKEKKQKHSYSIHITFWKKIDINIDTKTIHSWMRSIDKV